MTIVWKKPYLLRVVTRTAALGDPAFYYDCMKVAAEKEVAPCIHYMSIEDRISITDFVTQKPFSMEAAKEKPQDKRFEHSLQTLAKHHV